MALPVVELFCGIGGCAAALGPRADIVAAIDVNQNALDVYNRNSPTAGRAGTVESIPDSLWPRWQPALWWLSPPCQPFTRRGRRRDADDPRAGPFLYMIEKIACVRPLHVAIENVGGFSGSRVHRRLRETLDACHYHVQEHSICPSQLGVPNRRPRYYLVASLKPLRHLDGLHTQSFRFPLADVLDAEVPDALWVTEAFVAQYRDALDLVEAQPTEQLSHEQATGSRPTRDTCSPITACFTSAYGRSHIRSGSYLRTTHGVRRFSPHEILRLLCFPRSFVLSPNLSLEQTWPLVGNSLSVAAVQTVLQSIPELRETTRKKQLAKNNESRPGVSQSSDPQLQ